MLRALMLALAGLALAALLALGVFFASEAALLGDEESPLAPREPEIVATTATTTGTTTTGRTTTAPTATDPDTPTSNVPTLTDTNGDDGGQGRGRGRNRGRGGGDGGGNSGSGGSDDD